MQYISILTMTEHENRGQAVKEWMDNVSHSESDLYTSVFTDLLGDE